MKKTEIEVIIYRLIISYVHVHVHVYTSRMHAKIVQIPQTSMQPPAAIASHLLASFWVFLSLMFALLVFWSFLHLLSAQIIFCSVAVCFLQIVTQYVCNVQIVLR